MCGDDMRWNTDLVHQIFLPHEVEVILSITLSQRKPKDVLIWSGTKKGVFSVKSAYRMLLDLSHVFEASSSASVGYDSQLWKTIWSAAVQPKVKMFI
jgi:hypothetical protein